MIAFNNIKKVWESGIDPKEATKQSVNGSAKFQIRQFAESTLGKDSLKIAVMLPEGEDIKEWIASHLLDFYNHTNVLFCAVSHLCTETSCPVMSSGPRFQYLWTDKTKNVKAAKYSACKYIMTLMSWVNQMIDDENVFPRDSEVEFSDDFLTTIAPKIFSRLIRVYGHIYHHHYSDTTKIGLDTMLNTSFHHFILFVTRFRLVEGRELEPFREIIKYVY
ncbi:hypothetical protein BB559_002915 [Furculomyces boomerangus]|uniref:Mob1/phocein n=2 Tax=Harpellales TaxID=61421 RepID=A0A2T9YR25_9FUNG|nr:hypothetical protein BB559_002915 [Furculomyces boomerangus]PWA01208.1 hypothetical protein BB558_002694 [Smittium angustum]